MGQSTPLRQTAVVVEDDAIQRDMIAMLLEESEFDVVQYSDAETASVAIRTRQPSFLITDVNLAGDMNGVELARQAREQYPEMRVIVISGDPRPSSLPEDVAFYSKPVYPIILLREAAH